MDKKSPDRIATVLSGDFLYFIIMVFSYYACKNARAHYPSDQ